MEKQNKIPKWEKVKNWKHSPPKVVSVPADAVPKASFFSAEADGSWSAIYVSSFTEARDTLDDYEIALYEKRGRKLYLCWTR